MSDPTTPKRGHDGDGDRSPPPRPRPSVARTAATTAVEADDEIRGLSERELLERIDGLRRDRDAHARLLCPVTGENLDRVVQCESSRAPVFGGRDGSPWSGSATSGG